MKKLGENDGQQVVRFDTFYQEVNKVMVEFVEFFNEEQEYFDKNTQEEL